MKRILVPCDFSNTSISACHFAQDVAALSGSFVHLLNVVELPAMPNTVFTPVRSLGTALRRELAEKTEARFAKIPRKHGHLDVELTSSVEFGNPSKTILKYVKKHLIDMVIMGSHGSRGIRELFLGSNTARMVRSCPVPVIVVRTVPEAPIRNIVFPCGFDLEKQETLVSKVKELQKSFNAHLHLVWINTPANFNNDATTTMRLDAFARRYKLKDFTLSIFNHPFEEEGILLFAESIKADLIAMGTHGRKGISKIIFGSTTEDVANKGKIPIWTYLTVNAR